MDFEVETDLIQIVLFSSTEMEFSAKMMTETAWEDASMDFSFSLSEMGFDACEAY